MDGNNQTLILVDRRDKSLGYESKEKCHTGLGKRHRAFVTLLFDDKNRILLALRCLLIKTNGKNILSSHIRIASVAEGASIQRKIYTILTKDFGIYFSTIQAETECPEQETAKEIDFQ